MDVQDLDRRGLDATGGVIAALPAGAMDAPTPCADWTVADVIRHLVRSNDKHVAAAHGEEYTPASAQHPDSDALVDAFRRSSARVTEAFAEHGVLERHFALHGRPDLTGKFAIAIHFVDSFVHGWDLARAVDIPYRLDAELAAAALEISGRIPETPDLRAPGGPFGPRVPVPDDAPVADRLLGHLGRSPAWSALEATTR